MSRVDVIVVGGGNAALTAALAASDAGARVLLLERAPAWRRGGNSRHTRDIRFAHGEGDTWSPDPYPQDRFHADLAPIVDPDRKDLVDLLVRESASLPAWMEAHGVRWQHALRGTLHLQTNRFFLGGGKAMLNAYYARARAAGITILYDTQVTGLQIASERCVVVSAAGALGPLTLEATAAVISSGGFEANRDWLRARFGVGADNIVIRGTPDNDGALLTTLLNQGAAHAGSDSYHCIAVDARSPRYDGGIVTRVDSIPFGVVLNVDGKRFYDEGEAAWPKRYASWGGLIARQPQQLAFSIFDRCSFGAFIPPLYPPVEAPSLEALVAQLPLDRGRALATLAEYNAAVDDSTAYDHTRPDGRAALGVQPARSNWACRIGTPPFFAYPLRPGLTFSYSGVAIDVHGRVLRTDGRPYANLVAAGETMVGNLLRDGYLAGLGLTVGGVFGRIAGRHAADVS